MTIGFENHDHSYKRSKFIRNNTAVEDTNAPIYIGDGCWGVPPERPDTTRWYIENAVQSRYVMQVDVAPIARRVQLYMYNEFGTAFDSFVIQK